MELPCGRGTWRCAPEPGKRDDKFASMDHVALPNIGGVKADSAAKARVDGWGRRFRERTPPDQREGNTNEGGDFSRSTPGSDH